MKGNSKQNKTTALYKKNILGYHNTNRSGVGPLWCIWSKMFTSNILMSMSRQLSWANGISYKLKDNDISIMFVWADIRRTWELKWHLYPIPAKGTLGPLQVTDICPICCKYHSDINSSRFNSSDSRMVSHSWRWPANYGLGKRVQNQSW